MSCRLARWMPSQGHPVLPVTCEDCGAGSLTVFYTSKDEQIHLCPPCFQSRVKVGLAREVEGTEA